MKVHTLVIMLASLGFTTFADIAPFTSATSLSQAFAVKVVLTSPKHIDAALPAPTRQVLPEYPLVMREARIQGEALVGLTVEADGRVTKLRIVAETERAFGEATLEAARSWRYTPGKRGDQYVARDLEYSVQFQLP